MQRNSKIIGNRKVSYLTGSCSDSSVGLVFLHGFPDSPDVWRNQLKFFGEKYTILAPCTPGIWDAPLSYVPTADELAKDIIDLCNEFSFKHAYIIAHDLGGPVAGKMLAQAPAFFKKCIFINSLTIEQMYFRKKYFSQILKSYYIFLFQIPRLAKKVLKKIWPAMQKKMLKDNLIDEKENYQGPEVLASVGLYRSFFSEIKYFIGEEPHRISHHCEFIWGKNDAYLNIPTEEELETFYQSYNLTLVDSAHWPQLHLAEEVNNLIARSL